MKLRSAIVVGSFAAASGACPKIATPEAAYSQTSCPARRAHFARASSPRMARTLRASRRPPPRRAARENRPHSTAGFSAVAGGDAVAPKKNVKDGFFEWRVYQRLHRRHRRCRRVAPSTKEPHRQTKLMDDLATKYAKTDDAAAPASTAAKASSSSSSSSDDSSSDEVVEKKPLGTRLKNVGKKLAFWRK
jgi:hypothetical protein